jgi:hypothetical protein
MLLRHAPRHASWSRGSGKRAFSLPTTSDARFCAELLRTQDHDYWLMGLLLPESARRGFYAVRAFNAETATIIDAVRGNVFPGRMRVQWWRDTVHRIYTAPDTVPTGYPVVTCLAEAARAHGLSRRWLDRILDARERDLEIEHLPTLAELERCATQERCQRTGQALGSSAVENCSVCVCRLCALPPLRIRLGAQVLRRHPRQPGAAGARDPARVQRTSRGRPRRGASGPCGGHLYAAAWGGPARGPGAPLRPARGFPSGQGNWAGVGSCLA